METVLISGGTGLVGKALADKLSMKGYAVAFLSRTGNRDATIPTYAWNIQKNQIEKEALESADYIIHLAGANIGEKRWTSQQKQIIIDSRVNSGQLLFSKLKELKSTHLKAFISASAVGYYGAITTDKVFSETDPAYSDFIGTVCRKWEDSADSFETIGIRTVKIRTGVVLTKKHGALAKISQPIRLGVGSAIGNGRQYLPWIHIDDLCEIYIKAIEDAQMRGAYNAVAPEQLTNEAFTQTLARVLKKKIWLPPIPGFVMKFLFGEMSNILLQGSQVSSAKIKAAGYEFKFPELTGALYDLLINKEK